MKEALSIFAGCLILYSYIPYAKDIIKGKAVPARSARIMFTVLLALALLQQRSVGSVWTIAVTVGELIGTVGILWLALKFGVGGLKKLDLACYVLLGMSLIVWITTGSALLALYMTVLTDAIAFTPTLEKTWKNPKSETALFFILGVVAPLLNIIAARELTFAILLFPVYLALANLVEVLLIYRKQQVVL